MLRNPSATGGHGPEASEHRVSLKAWFSSLSKGVKWLVGAVIAAGAVAGAIGAIIALLPKPTPELRAAITKLSIDQNVTLSEYRARNAASALDSVRATAPDLVAEFSAMTTGDITTGGTATSGTTTSETTTSGTTSRTTTSGTTTSGTTTTKDGKVLPLLSPEARAHLDEGVKRAVNQPPGEIPIIIGPACSSNPSGQNCGLGTVTVYMQVLNEDGSPGNVDPAKVADRLAKLLAASRMQLIAGGKVPVGVTINYDISLTGFRGRRVTVRWSLYRAPGGNPVPASWLKNRPVHWLQGEANKDSASDSFWVPLPKTGGPFYVRVGVYDEDNVRLDFENSRTFQ